MECNKRLPDGYCRDTVNEPCKIASHCPMYVHTGSGGCCQCLRRHKKCPNKITSKGVMP